MQHFNSHLKKLGETAVLREKNTKTMVQEQSPVSQRAPSPLKAAYYWDTRTSKDYHQINAPSIPPATPANSIASRGQSMSSSGYPQYLEYANTHLRTNELMAANYLSRQPYVNCQYQQQYYNVMGTHFGAPDSKNNHPNASRVGGNSSGNVVDEIKTHDLQFHEYIPDQTVNK